MRTSMTRRISGANHDALHYGNVVTYLRLNGLVPSGGWF